MIALGGGAVGSEAIRATRSASARSPSSSRSTPTTAWTRVARRRPPARAGRGRASARSTQQRQPLYEEVADAVAARRRRASCSPRRGSTSRSGRSRGSRELVPDGAVALVADAHVAGSTAPTRSSRSAIGAPVARAARRRGGEDASPSVERLWRELRLDRGRDDRRARRRLHDRRGRLRRRHVPARHRVGRGADDARRPGRRGDRRQDGDRPARGQEPRRRLPLARADGDRPGAPRDAAGGAAPRGWPRS